MAVVAGSFVAIGQSEALTPELGTTRGSGQFNVLLSGMVAGDLVTLERSFDGGATFFPVIGFDGTTTPVVNEVRAEPETSVQWRFDCTALAAAGPIVFRLST